VAFKISDLRAISHIFSLDISKVGNSSTAQPPAGKVE